MKAARRGLCARVMLRQCAGWLIAAGLLLGAATAHAQIGSDRYSAIVTDATTGRVLIAANPDDLRHPASLTKMMTLYMVFEALRDRRLQLGQYVPVSAHAASMEPTKLGLVPGNRITVQQAILGLVTKSANDAASALGEMLGGGSEAQFAQMMTLRAHAIGMTRTVFRNASGLPDPDQVTTARDLSTLARHLIHDFPAQYRYFSVPSFQFRGRTIMNHDRMLQTYPGADGLKTGYTDASGFNLVTSAVHGNVRLIGVVMGAARPGERDLHMAALLDRGFDQVKAPQMVAQREPASPLPTARVGFVNSVPNDAAPVRRRQIAQRWGVSISGFSTAAAARGTAERARRAAEAGELARVEPFAHRGRTLYRAILVGLSQPDVREVCGSVPKRGLVCAPIRPENGEVASR